MNMPQKNKESEPVKKVVHKAIIGFATTSKMKARGWYLNCGSSEHVCHAESFFKDYKPLNTVVILDNGVSVDVIGIGTVELRFKGDKVLTLLNVLHIPSLSRCYVSVAKLDELGYIISYENGIGTITKSDEVIGQAYNLGDCVYQLSLEGDPSFSKVIANEDPDAADYDPMSSEIIITFGGGQCVMKIGGVVVRKGCKDDLLYKMEVVKEPTPHDKVVCHEPIGLLKDNEQSELNKPRAFDDEKCYFKKDQQSVGDGYAEDGLFRLNVMDERSGGN